MVVSGESIKNDWAQTGADIQVDIVAVHGPHFINVRQVSNGKQENTFAI